MNYFISFIITQANIKREMISNRLNRIKEASSDSSTVSIKAPNYENDQFSPIYKRYEKVERQTQIINKTVNEIVDLFDKKSTLVMNNEISKARNIITHYLADLQLMISEVERDIKKWQKQCDKFKNRKELTQIERVNLTHYLSASVIFTNAVKNYLSMKEYIDEKTEQRIRRNYQIAEQELKDDKLKYLQEHEEELENTSLYTLQNYDPIEAQISFLEVEVADIARQMKDLNLLTVSLYALLQDQSEKIRKIEEITVKASDFIDIGNEQLTTAKEHQRKIGVCRI